MDNLNKLNFDELIEVYKMIEGYLGFLEGELQNFTEPEAEQGEEK